MKHKTNIVARWFIMVMLCLASVKTFASTDPTIKKTLAGYSVHVDSSIQVSDKFYDASYSGKIDTPFLVRNIVTLRINEDSLFLFPKRFNATVNVRIYLTRPDGTVDSADKQLAVHYKPDSIYNNRSYFFDTGAHKVNVKVLSVAIDSAGAYIDSSRVWPALLLDNEMVSSPNYIFSCSGTDQVITTLTMVTGTSLDSSHDEEKVSWSFRKGADEYDLEWTYIDSSALARDTIGGAATIFANNATRISTTNNTYSIPLIYGNGGVLFTRVRAVQIKSDGTRIAAVWSSNYTTGLGKCAYTGHQGNLNWQSSITFAEGGKRKVVVQYYDGSLRSRQTVTKDNTTLNTVVAETFYDFQGRPVIQVLPAPTLNTVISYVKNFNTSDPSGVNEYLKDSFDNLSTDTSCCSVSAPAMDSVSGASFYYSSNIVPYKSSVQYASHIPDAFGNVFTETLYTQDNTGRISAQGGVGPSFRIGSGHETKYYYGSPDQKELDALFGTEVGDKMHYFKNMVRDANGQFSVSYVDMHGRTIATALAGSPPDSIKLDKLPSFDSTSITETIADPTTNVTKGLVMESDKSLLVSSPGDYYFKYDLGPQSLKEKPCTGDSVCYNCLYNLEITITGDCNNKNLPNRKRFDTTISNFSLVTFSTSGCSSDTGFHFKDTMWLDVGNYEITKKLSISSYGKQQYQDSVFLKKNVCTTVQSLITTELSQQNRSNCVPTCQACSDSLGTWSSFKTKFMMQTGASAADSALAWTAYQSALAACTALCDTANGLNIDIRQAMLADVSAPSGQYANTGIYDSYSMYYPSGTPSVAPYKRSSFVYYDNNGRPDSVLNDSTGLFGVPQLLDTAQFSRKFRPSWANALLVFHPEYCKLLTYDRFANSLLWDKKFEKVDTFSVASAKGYLNPTANPSSPFSSYTYITANKDSLAIDSSALQTLLEDSLVYYKIVTIGASTDSISLWTFAAMMTKCNGDSACSVDFIENHRAFEMLSCDGDRDVAWQHFRDLYLQIKANIIDTLVSSASCTGFLNPSSSTIVYAKHFPNFNNAQDAIAQDSSLRYILNSSDTTGAKDSVNNASHNYYVANCNAYVNLWKQQLAPCMYDSATLNGIIMPELVNVCLKGSDASHPLGSRDISPDSSYTFANFDSVLNSYNRAHGINKLACNADLIPEPKPYFNQAVYSNKPVIGKPADCECTQISSLYAEYTTNALSSDTTFSAYLARQYHTVINETDLDKLRSLCADTSDCKYTTKPLYLPPVFQCYSGDICVTCNEVGDLYQQFQAIYDTVPKMVTAEDSLNYQPINQLFANFMNNHLGFDKQAYEYLAFIAKCNNAGGAIGVGGMTFEPYFNNGIGVNTDNLFTGPPIPLPSLKCVGCDSLQHFIKMYFDKQFNGAGNEADMLTFIKDTLATKGLTTTTADIKQALLNCHNSWQQNVAYGNRWSDLYFPDTANIRIGKYGENFSIELWANFSDTVDGFTTYPYHGMQAIATAATTNFFDTSWRSGFVGYRLYWQFGKIYFLLGDGSARHNQGGSIWVGTASTITPRQWHHLVVTRSGNDSSGIKIYVDSVLMTTVTQENCNHLNTGYTNGNLSILLSNFSYSGGWGLPSLLFNNFRLYDRALSDSEVKANYISCSSVPADTASLKLWCKMNEGSGLPVDFSQYHTASAWNGSYSPQNWWGGFGPSVCPGCLVHDTSVVCNYASADSLLLCGKSQPLFPPDTSKPVTCCSDSTFFSTSIGTEWYRIYIDSARNRFDSDYTAKCLQASNYESFTVSHTLTEYHYTLYYYDQAGNLVKTVPPKGVQGNWRQTWYDSVKTARANNTVLVPSHSLITQYRYNTLNQVSAQQTPDAGQSNFWYDRLGRMSISQNAKQQPQNKYSYTTYDYLSRIDEVGEITNSTAMTNATSRSETSLTSWINAAASTKTQITQTSYDTAYSPLAPVMAAKNLRSRVAWAALYSTKTDLDNLGFSVATFYSYDFHGYVDTLIEDYGNSSLHPNAMNDTTGTGRNRFKKIVYQYDLISGKINWVGYQPGQPDAFYHSYAYDAENRITNVATSADSIVWENEAFYKYYRHGPLAQVILGQQQVQGVEYAYTLQGWLKAINGSVTGSSGRDIGGDGDVANKTTVHVARDAYGLALYYYKNDYSKVDVAAATRVADISNTGSGFKPLFNGNIAASSINAPTIGVPLLYTYTYDQLNRLTAMNTWGGINLSTNTWTATSYNAYQERASYDANGNILTYNRWGNGTTSASIMDKLTYTYYANSNKLDNVADSVPDASFAGDIDNQATHNYTYDPIGNLTKDVKEGIDTIYWTVYRKIQSIVKHDTTISYTYDPSGNRISKTVTKPASAITTWYVRDANGNIMSVYKTGDTLNSGQLTQTELHLYGNSRLGIYRPNVNVHNLAVPDTTILSHLGNGYAFSYLRGRKFFELTNHLGNVLVTISDKKIGVDDGTYYNLTTGAKISSTPDSVLDYYIADVVSAQDYYPFGMVEPARQFTATNSTGYRFGFNDKEKSDEINGSGVDYDYGFRIYDARIAKFLSVDPLIKSYPMLTSYQFASNSPILNLDMDGAESAAYFRLEHHYSPSTPLGHIAYDIANSVIGKTASGTVHGVYNTVRDSYKFFTSDMYKGSTWRNIGEFANEIPYSMSTVKVFQTPMIDAKVDEFINDVIRGDAYSRSNYIAGFATNIFIGYVTDKGIGSISEIAQAKIASRFFIRTAQTIEEHLSQAKFLNESGTIDAGNQIMIDRIRKIAKGEIKATQTDINFMNHELTEAALMKKGMTYEEAHAEALKKHGISNDHNAEKKIYTQEALDASNAEINKDYLGKKNKKN